MIADELREQLKTVEQDIATIKAFWLSAGIQDRFAALELEINHENFWKNPDRESIIQQHRSLRHSAETYPIITKTYADYLELIEIFKDNEQELASVKDDLFALCRRIKKFKIELLLNKKDDTSACYVNINAGAGGTESQDWADMLLRMYLRFCEREGYSVQVLDYQDGEGAGIKSATLYIRGSHPFGIFKTEAGIHRLVRISPFDANKRRHTSFAGISIMPEVADAAIEIKDDDLRIDTFRAGGAGGQHVNKTESAIRITHLPTNIVVQCQNERSQNQNKQTAMKMLKAKLVAKQEEEKRARAGAIEKKKIEWGSQIRSYVLHPYKMVKDHRTDYESGQPDNVLDGDLMPFIEAFLISSAQDIHE